MGQRRLKQILMVTFIAIFAVKARAQQAEYYPHGALNNSYYQEQAEQRRTDEAENAAVAKRDDYDKQKRQVDREIALHQFHIEELKTKQQKAKADLELTQVSVQHVRDQISTYEAEHKQLNEDTQIAMTSLTEQLTELEASTKKMEKELAALTDDRKRAEREIYAKSMELNRMKSENARTETKVAAAEAKRTELDADEMKVRTEWMQAKMQSAELSRQRDEATAQLNESKQRWTQAQKELVDTKNDLAKVQHNRDLTVAQVKLDVERYEKEILAASKARISSEAEQIRLASEADKMKDYASRIRESRDQANEQETDSSGLVLRTKVAVETARTELTQDVESADRKGFEKDREASRKRGLAAADSAANLLGGSRIWKTTTKCNAYASPSSSDTPVGYFDSGRKLLGKDNGNTWIEISNGSGKTVFVESKCGNYQN